ncbi:MAG: 3-deoxy-D-manno-octulosonate 8-phosphate phosphatase [Pseudomonadota bacterium]
MDLRLIVFDFDGVFTDNCVYVSEDGQEMVKCSRADGIGLRKLEACGLQLLILSTEKNPVVARRAEKLNIECIHGCDDKLTRLRQELETRGFTWSQVAFVGNDINDAECLETVGVPLVVADARPEVLPLGLATTRTPGGQGAVREICDYIATAFEAKGAA